jgi:hypothetical protein
MILVFLKASMTKLQKGKNTTTMAKVVAMPSGIGQ